MKIVSDDVWQVYLQALEHLDQVDWSQMPALRAEVEITLRTYAGHQQLWWVLLSQALAHWRAGAAARASACALVALRLAEDTGENFGAGCVACQLAGMALRQDDYRAVAVCLTRAQRALDLAGKAPPGGPLAAAAQLCAEIIHWREGYQRGQIARAVAETAIAQAQHDLLGRLRQASDFMRAAWAGQRPLGGDDLIDGFPMLLRPRASGAGAATAQAAKLPHERQYLSRAALAAATGADTNDIAEVVAFAHAHGLDVVETSIPRRSIVLAGTLAAMSTAFNVTLQQYAYSSSTYRGRTGPIHVPPELAPIVQAVLGLDDRPQAAPHFRILHPTTTLDPEAEQPSFTPLQLADLYAFPAGIDGHGQTIALIELGGGYHPAELTTYFTRLGLTPPKVSAVSVDHKRNHPAGNPNSADGEVVLDIEVAGTMAPGAQIVVYFAPNTDRGFLDAITTAIHDQKYAPSVLSISWGAPESAWTAQALQAFDQAFQDAAALGITVCCASGDNGSSDGMSDGQAHVDFPAASPYVLACGGTRLEVAGDTISSEVVWNDGADGGATGGGVSDVFPLPDWQRSAHIPASANDGTRTGRGVPDVAGDADPATGYRILVDGQQAVFGGTSAVAPLWAALIARLNQQLGQPVGYLNPLLYGRLLGSCNDITSGSNGAYQAQAGWDACTGLGSPDGAMLLRALAQGG